MFTLFDLAVQVTHTNIHTAPEEKSWYFVLYAYTTYAKKKVKYCQQVKWLNTISIQSNTCL